MSDHRDLSDTEFLEALERCSLPKEYFNHEAHLRLAWLILQEYGLDRALWQVPRYIKNYVRHLGATDKYHHTLTVAAVYMIHSLRAVKDVKDFDDLLQSFPKLKSDFKSLVFRHYSQDRFNHHLARSQYISPDLIAFRTE